MIDTHVKTKSVTNTQLAVAVGIAVLAGGLAFAAAPEADNDVNSCTVQTITFGKSCGRSKVRGASYVCADGSEGRAPSNNCKTPAQLQRIAENACARKQCVAAPVVVEEAPAAPESPAPAPAPVAAPVGQADLAIGPVTFNNEKREVTIAVKNIGTAASIQLFEEDEGAVVAWRDINGAYVKMGVYRVEALGVGEEYGYIIPYPESDVPLRDIRIELDGKSKITESNEENNNGVFELPSLSVDTSAGAQAAGQTQGVPYLAIMGKDLSFQVNGNKASISVNLKNTGTATAGTDVKYKLLILDINHSPLYTYDLNLSSDLAVGDTQSFGTTVPIPTNAAFVQVVIDPPYTDGYNAIVTNPIPPELFQ